MLVSNKYFFNFITTLVVVAECSTVKKAEVKNESDKERSKRESIFSSPIYYDSIPLPEVKPGLITSPVIKPPSQQQQHQQHHQQQQQGLPILGALVSNVPGVNGVESTLTTLVPIGNLGNLGNLGGLGSMGALGNWQGLGGLGGLGNLGALGNLGGLTNLGALSGWSNWPGGTLPGTVPRCPLTQTLNCRCENLLPLPPNPKRSADGLEILQQSIKFNLKGDQEISARLSNGLLLYQRSGIEKLANNKYSKVIQGFYTIQIKENKYLTIYYTLNDLDYTVKAGVTAEPPQNDLDESPATVKL